jgi:hypothetical protein
MNISDRKDFEWLQAMHQVRMNRLRHREELARVKREEVGAARCPHSRANVDEAARPDPPPRH